MNRLEALETHLEEVEKQALDYYVELAEEYRMQHFVIRASLINPVIEIPTGENIPIDHRWEGESVLVALDSLGFVNMRKGEKWYWNLTLLTPAFHKVIFERKWGIFKWLTLQILRYRDYMALVAFVLSLWLAWKELFG